MEHAPSIKYRGSTFSNTKHSECTEKTLKRTVAKADLKADEGSR